MIRKPKEMIFLQTIMKIFMILLAVALLLGFCFFLYICYVLGFRATEIDTASSPDGIYTIELQQVGEPFLYSSTGTRLILKEGKKRICKIDTHAYNDGGNLDPDHWNFHWEEDRVTVILDGADQDREVIIYFNGEFEEKDLD